MLLVCLECHAKETFNFTIHSTNFLYASFNIKLIKDVAHLIQHKTHHINHNKRLLSR